MRQNLGLILIGTVILLVVLSMSLFVVDVRQRAIVFRFGEVVQVINTPGLYIKMPLVDNVRYFDGRLLTIEGAEPSMLMGKPLVQARPLPTKTLGWNGSCATRIPSFACFSFKRASVMSGFCWSAISTAWRSVTGCSPPNREMEIAKKEAVFIVEDLNLFVAQSFGRIQPRGAIGRQKAEY